jgi:hypothetical protein
VEKGKMSMMAAGPSPHLEALIENMEDFREANTVTTPALRVCPAPIVVRRISVSEERDPRIEPSVKPLVLTIVTMVLALGGIYFWMF